MGEPLSFFVKCKCKYLYETEREDSSLEKLPFENILWVENGGIYGICALHLFSIKICGHKNNAWLPQENHIMHMKVTLVEEPSYIVCSKQPSVKYFFYKALSCFLPITC